MLVSLSDLKAVRGFLYILITLCYVNFCMLNNILVLHSRRLILGFSAQEHAKYGIFTN